MHDADGNRIAEYDYDPGTQISTLLREYVWMNGQIIAVIEGGVVYYVRTDHIGRPVFATDDLGTKVWEASYLPFGGVHTSSGANSELRFPGQWFQAEAGLHQNWMRDYDPTTGRYIQADPLGLVDGPSIYGYALQNPMRYTDFFGLHVDPRDKMGVPPNRIQDISDEINGSCGFEDEPDLNEPVIKVAADNGIETCALAPHSLLCSETPAGGGAGGRSQAAKKAKEAADKAAFQAKKAAQKAAKKKSTNNNPGAGRNGGAATGDRINKHPNKKGGKSTSDKHNKKAPGTKTKSRGKPGWRQR